MAEPNASALPRRTLLAAGAAALASALLPEEASAGQGLPLPIPLQPLNMEPIAAVVVARDGSSPNFTALDPSGRPITIFCPLGVTFTLMRADAFAKGGGEGGGAGTQKNGTILAASTMAPKANTTTTFHIAQAEGLKQNVTIQFLVPIRKS